MDNEILAARTQGIYRQLAYAHTDFTLLIMRARELRCREADLNKLLIAEGYLLAAINTLKEIL